MKSDIIQLAVKTLSIEAKAIENLAQNLDGSFENTINKLLECTGKVIVIGMGKSGHIGNKIAATLSSTGTPSFFMHPAEASHGDLGMIQDNDVLLMLSNSGETAEIICLLPALKRKKNLIISITGNLNSTLARNSDIHLDAKVEKEACPHNLAPTTSTTVTLALGDAIAICLLEKKSFTEQDFAISHPGGSLGKRLLTRVKDIMRIDDNLPMVSIDSNFNMILLEMTQKGLGMTAIVNNKIEKKLLGIFTDGDLRRLINQNINFSEIFIEDVINKNPKFITPEEMAAFAVNIMENNAVSQLLVVDNNINKTLVGAFNMQDLLIAKII